MKHIKSKLHLIIIFIIVNVIGKSEIHAQVAVAQSGENAYCFKFTTSFISPFLRENNFERIGSILALKGGFAYKLPGDKYLALEAGTSLFFPKGGGPIGDPKILPQLKLEFANTAKVSTLLTAGQIYNPSLGLQLDINLKITKNQNNYILSGFLTGINHTFNLKTGELRTSPPTSWLALGGIKYVRPLPKDWVIVFKGGMGLRGDSDFKPKFIGNGSLIFGWDFITLVGSYTNIVPERGFPEYFVSVVEIDFTKLWRRYISKKNCTIRSALIGY